MTTTTKVLYVGGWGRSGSTLLARILGEHPSMAFVGEVRGTFLRGLLENRRCGCGVVFRACPFWSEVGEHAFGGWDRAPLVEALELRAVVDKPWWVAALRADRLPPHHRARTDRYVELFGRVYRGIQAVVGPDTWIVDSSKIPSFAVLLRRLPEVELRTAHLVRDARGSVFSWQKQVARNDTPDGQSAEMLRYGVPGASSRYVVYNRQTERLADGGPYVLTRYEDLVTAPEAELDRIVARLGLPGWRAGQLRDGEIRLGESHSVVGNPMRMHTGWIPLRPDLEWRERMQPAARSFTTAVTATTLRRYRYEVTA